VPSPTATGEPALSVLPEEAQDRRLARRRLAAVAVVGALLVGAVALVDLVRDDGPPSPPPGTWTLVPHEGLGAWIDVYDWTVELGGPEPSVGLEDIDAMAEAGVQTVYVQTAHQRAADDVLEPERLGQIIERAHAHDMYVVAWYLPTLVDVDRDLRRLLAASELPVDGLGVDIESVELPDPAERTRRILDLSEQLRAELGEDKVLAAITLSSVHVEVVNPEFWPGYPWAELAATYDVIMPMAYWSIRQGDLRAGFRYVDENLARIRAAVGDDVPLHPVGGVADAVTTVDLEGMVRAIEERGAIGGGLYDWATSTREQWAVLAPLRELREDIQ
jgi:hypothetical protein